MADGPGACRMYQSVFRYLGVYETIGTQTNHAAGQALVELRPRQLLRMRYEDPIASPVDELTTVGAFLGFTDPAAWAATTAPQVRAPRTAPGVRGARRHPPGRARAGQAG